MQAGDFNALGAVSRATGGAAVVASPLVQQLCN
jgi:hypothetical protein